MAEVKWIKIMTDIFDDEKIMLIENLPKADSIIVIWFKLLCLAGKQNNSGVFTVNDKIPYTEKMLATIFRRKEVVIKQALQKFEEFGMIEIINGTITIPNWGKHQSFDKIEKNNEYMRNYMREYRSKQKNLTEKQKNINSKTDVNINSKINSKTNVRPLEEDKEKEEDKEIDNTVAVVAGDSCGDGLQLVDSCDDELKKVIDFYKNNVGAITPYSLEIFTDYLKELSSDVIIYAMKKAVEADKRAINYIKGTLNNWIKKGIKTLIEAEKESENFKNKKQTTKPKTVKEKSKQETEFDQLIKQNFLNEELKKTIYDFIKMRITINKPLTKKGLELMIKKLKSLSNNENEQIEILNNSIMNNWQGIFPLKKHGEKGSINDFQRLWEEAKAKDEQTGNSTSNNTFGW